MFVTGILFDHPEFCYNRRAQFSARAVKFTLMQDCVFQNLYKSVTFSNKVKEICMGKDNWR